jgi:hypothetical protein
MPPQLCKFLARSVLVASVLVVTAIPGWSADTVKTETLEA